jgi:hypothetical protein
MCLVRWGILECGGESRTRRSRADVVANQRRCVAISNEQVCVEGNARCQGILHKVIEAMCVCVCVAATDAVQGIVQQVLQYGRVVRPVLGITLAPPQV